MRVVMFVITMLVATQVFAGDKELSDADAKKIAQNMVAVIDKAKKNLVLATETNDRVGYRNHVYVPINAAINKWPEDHLRNRVIFPYFSCREAAMFFVDYAQTYVTKDSVGNRMMRESSIKNFNKSYLECKSSIKKPDMSLKEIR